MTRREATRRAGRGPARFRGETTEFTLPKEGRTP